MPMKMLFCLFFIALGSCVALSTDTNAISGSVVVDSGNTLKVHSEPSTSSTTLYSLSNGAEVTLECYMKGTSVSGSQGTTDQWDQIKSSTYGVGYASHAYIASYGILSLCSSSGQVVVASGNTLKVHSSPTTASSSLYSLANGAVVTITCVTTGDTVSGS